MSIKGMEPRFNYTGNNCGIKIFDYIDVKQKVKQDYNVKFSLPKRDTYYSTDNFIQAPMTYSSAATFNGFHLAYNNVVKIKDSVHKTSNIDNSNQIDFSSGEWVKLGEYNGITVEFMKNEYGNLEMNLGIPAEKASKPGEPSNTFENKVLEMNRRISDSQHKEIGSIKWAFQEFCKVADDEMSISTIDSQHHKFLILGLEKMGINLSKPFAINGEEFYLRNDTGKIDYYNVKKYVVHEDGHVEIRDAEEEDPVDIWNELKEKYNVRKASSDDINDISKKLFNAGLITSFECAWLTFDPGKSTQSVKPDIYLTKADDYGRRDWIAEYESRLASNLKNGDLQSYKYNQNSLDILRELL